MNKKWLIGVGYIVFGMVIILLPRVFFPVCGLENDPFYLGEFSMHHGCHATLNAVSLLGALTVLIGIVSVLFPKRKVLISAFVLSIAISVFIILFPIKITGICKMATMPCRMGTLPGLVVAGIVLGTVSVFGFVKQMKNK